MTAQASDLVAYRGQDYSIAWQGGTGLFDPHEHGLDPVGRSSACWRGFVCGYRVEDEALWLARLSVCLDEPAPVLFGVQPKPFEATVCLGGIEFRVPWFDVVYEELNHKVPYSGALWLARDPAERLPDLLVGFPPIWRYREVHQLAFDHGELTQAADRSQALAELRQYLASRGPDPERGAVEAEIRKWVERHFRQEPKQP